MRVENDQLKYDYIVAPFANPKQIKCEYKGIENIFLKDRNLYIQTSVNTIIEQEPYAYQIIAGEKIEVPCEYQLKRQKISFEFPEGYDSNYELIIDPLLVFSTYSGSTADNFGYTATYDQHGFLYAGSTSFGVVYPTSIGAYQINFAGGTGNGGTDIAITKYDTSGTSRLYSTYLGGDLDELPHSMIVNSSNELLANFAADL